MNLMHFVLGPYDKKRRSCNLNRFQILPLFSRRHPARHSQGATPASIGFYAVLISWAHTSGPLSKWFKSPLNHFSNAKWDLRKAISVGPIIVRVRLTWTTNPGASWPRLSALERASRTLAFSNISSSTTLVTWNGKMVTILIWTSSL